MTDRYSIASRDSQLWGGNRRYAVVDREGRPGRWVLETGSFAHALHMVELLNRGITERIERPTGVQQMMTEVDRTSHSYLLGQTEYRLKACQVENERLRDALEDIACHCDHCHEIARKALS
jgi:hypothetical protein